MLALFLMIEASRPHNRSVNVPKKKKKRKSRARKVGMLN